MYNTPSSKIRFLLKEDFLRTETKKRLHFHPFSTLHFLFLWLFHRFPIFKGPGFFPQKTMFSLSSPPAPAPRSCSFSGSSPSSPAVSSTPGADKVTAGSCSSEATSAHKTRGESSKEHPVSCHQQTPNAFEVRPVIPLAKLPNVPGPLPANAHWPRCHSRPTNRLDYPTWIWFPGPLEQLDVFLFPCELEMFRLHRHDDPEMS